MRRKPGYIRNAAMLTCVLLAACAAPAPAPVADEAPGVRLSIDTALARAQAHKDRAANARVPARLDEGLITVIWEGEGAEILKRIAAAHKLHFKISGPQPRLQLPVFVKLRDVSLVTALEAIADQFGGRADVVLTDDAIELKMRLY